MNYNEKFEQIYEKIVENYAYDLENLRKDAQGETLKKYIITITLSIIAIILFFIVFIIYNENSMIALFAIGIYAAILLFWRVKIGQKDKESKIEKYRNYYKTKIIKNLLEPFGEINKYIHYSGISKFTYDEAEFENYDLYSSKDYIEGSLKSGSCFYMAEVSTKFKGKRMGDALLLFCGLFSKVELPNPFVTCLYIRKNRKEINFIDKAFRTKLPFDDLRVKLDSQEFEEMFDVYCSDKIIAIKLFTTDIMDLLINFQKEMNIEYEITIKNNLMYIRFKTGKMFENPNVIKKSLDKLTLYRYYSIVDFIFNLTNRLINIINDTKI